MLPSHPLYLDDGALCAIPGEIELTSVIET